MQVIVRLIIATSLCVLLAACGGGGGSDSGDIGTILASQDPGNLNPDSGNQGSGNQGTGDQTGAPQPDTTPDTGSTSGNTNGGSTTDGGSTTNGDVAQNDDPPQVDPEPGAQTVAVKLSWQAPEQRENGDTLELYEIANYEIYVYDQQGDFSVFVTDGADTEWINDMQPGTYQIAMLAIDTDGLRSDLSTAVEAQITQ